MSSHADTIFRVLSTPTPVIGEREQASKALDALLVENQRLRDERDEWERIAVRTSAEAGNEIRRIRAREALAGDAE